MKDPTLRDEFLGAVKEGSKGFFAPLVLAFRVMKSAEPKDLSAFRGHSELGDNTRETPTSPGKV